jgi:taurine dioxygenase
VTPKPLEPFGGEVEGFDLAEPGGASPGDVRRAVARHKVLVLRGQTCDARQFAAFLASMGEPMFTEGETPVDNAPNLNIVTNEGRTTPPRSVFHTDTSYVAHPPAITALLAIELPRSGGQTLFCDQAATLAGLPSPWRDCLRDRQAEHAAGPRDTAREAAHHPLVLAHPETGEEALYITTPERCARISGLSDQDAARITSALYRRSIRPGRLYRHTWRAGDVVLWDNRLTMHRADHSAVDGTRTLYRGMIR